MVQNMWMYMEAVFRSVSRYCAVLDGGGGRGVQWLWGRMTGDEIRLSLAVAMRGPRARGGPPPDVALTPCLCDSSLLDERGCAIPGVPSVWHDFLLICTMPIHISRTQLHVQRWGYHEAAAPGGEALPGNRQELHEGVFAKLVAVWHVLSSHCESFPRCLARVLDQTHVECFRTWDASPHSPPHCVAPWTNPLPHRR